MPASKPCAAVRDALEALAMNFYGFGGLVCPILDARRGQVYCALFTHPAGRPAASRRTPPSRWASCSRDCRRTGR